MPAPALPPRAAAAALAETESVAECSSDLTRRQLRKTRTRMKMRMKNARVYWRLPPAELLVGRTPGCPELEGLAHELSLLRRIPPSKEKQRNLREAFGFQLSQ